jgi:phosphoribosylanthranilate isomerase
MGVSIKICGINTREAANAALAAGADFGGLVFHARSPRHLSFEQGRALAAHMRGRTRIVALFADAGDAEMAGAIASVKPDLIQLHGKETPTRVGHLRARFKLPVIKSVAIADGADVMATHAYDDSADFLLFDTKAPESATRAGGHGVSFDWKLLAGVKFKLPWLLAGGLTPENVARAISVSGARMVDVSSGVEDAPGKKNPDKIAAFVKAARSTSHKIDESEKGAA